jgi:hypothetical protein
MGKTCVRVSGCSLGRFTFCKTKPQKPSKIMMHCLKQKQEGVIMMEAF